MSFSSASSDTATPNPAETDVPLVGYRFHPTDRELITNYLGPKNRGEDDHDPVIADIEVCKSEPWDLPVLSMIKSNDPVWYFYCRRERKSQKSNRSNRTTKEGYWKPDGKARPIKAKRSKEVIGSKRTLVFHLGRPKGTRTEWVMHEYECSPKSGLSCQGDFVLCKLKNKSDEKNTKGVAYHPTAMNPEIESHELAEVASISSHGISEPSHLICYGSYNKNQDLRMSGDVEGLVDANSMESSPTYESNMDSLSVADYLSPLSVADYLQTSSQKLSQPPENAIPNSHTQICPRLLANNTSPCHNQNNGIGEVFLTQIPSQTPKTTLQTSNIQNSDSVGAITTSLCRYQNNDSTEVALSQQAPQTPKTTLQTSYIQTFDSLPAINSSSLCHYQNNGISEVTSFDCEEQANAYSENYSKAFVDSFRCDASDGYSISPSQSAISSGTVVDSTHDVTDSLISDFENQNSENQDGMPSASVEVAWSPSMATSYTDYGTRNQYDNFDILDHHDGLFVSDLESKYEEPEQENSEFSSELWGASLDSILEQYRIVNSPLSMPIHFNEGLSSSLFPLECDSTLRPSPLYL